PNKPNPPLSPALVLRFHRLDLRYHQTIGNLETTYRVVGGYDRTFSMGTDFSVLLVEPEIRSRYKLDDHLTFAAGLVGDARDLKQGSGTNGAAGGLAPLTKDLSTSQV